MPKLTKRWVDAWRPDVGRDVIEWDFQVPGFGVRAYPGSRRRSWLIQYRVGSSTRRRMPQRSAHSSWIHCTHAAVSVAQFSRPAKTRPVREGSRASR